MIKPRTAFLLSRGMRVGPVWRAMADELSRDYRVVAAVEKSELAAWQGTEAELIVIDDEIERAAASVSGRWKEEAARIEQETELTAYRAAQPYLLYRRFNLKYFGSFPRFYESEDTVLREYVGSYFALRALFERWQPDVCFYETPDLISHFMALVLSFQRGVFCYGLHFPGVFGDGKIMLTYGVSRQNVRLNYLYANPELISAKSWEGADGLLVRAQTELLEMSYITAAKTSAPSRSIFRRIISRLLAPDFWRDIRSVIHHRRNVKWLSTRVAHAPPSNPYVVVFLQRQPEASTTAQAPRWVDQEKVVERLATNAPIGWTILVKENPRTYGARGRDYFGPLLDIPNVRLCHPAVPTIDLLRGSEGIVAITGTVGLEGLMMGKRVVALGRPFYAVCDGVCVVDDEEMIIPALRDPAWAPDKFAASRRVFVAALLEAVDDFGPAPVGQIWPEAGIAGAQLAEALQRVDAFVQRFGIMPDQFGWPVAAHVPAARWKASHAALKRQPTREIIPA